MSKREFFARTLEKTGLGTLLSSTVCRWNGLLVFNYHRIGDPAHSPFDRALYSAGVEEFEQQVRFLRKNSDVVGIGDLDQVFHKPHRAVLITFDDGYRDNYDLAFPVLKQENVPATFFVTSGFIDDRPISWWDEIAWMVRNCLHTELPDPTVEGEFLPLATPEDQETAIQKILRYYKDLPLSQTAPFLDELADTTGSGRCPTSLAQDVWMDWDMIREMDQAGMDIGGHTVTHPVLARASTEQQHQEIFDSKQRIETELGHSISAFSYPVGQPTSFTEVTKAILKDAGYQWAFSFSGGFSRIDHTDAFDLPRVAVSPFLSLNLFQATARFPAVFA